MDFTGQLLEKMGITISVKTPFGPEVTVYDATAPSTGPGLAEHVGVVIRDRNGSTVWTNDRYPATNPLLMAVAAGVLLWVGYKLTK